MTSATSRYSPSSCGPSEHEGDVVIGLSTSGNSLNVIKALEVAKKGGMRTVVLTGGSGGKMANMADFTFIWHTRPGALERLTPPWEQVVVEERTGGIEDGARVVLRLTAGPIKFRWVALHGDTVPGRAFYDRQIQGPFRSWRHCHRFEPVSASACRLEDDLEYSLPLGWLGRIVGAAGVRVKLERMFAFRHAVTKADIETHAERKGRKPMHVAVTGSRGLVGSAMVAFLTTGGHRVTRLVAPDGLLLCRLVRGYFDVCSG